MVHVHGRDVDAAADAAFDQIEVVRHIWAILVVDVVAACGNARDGDAGHIAKHFVVDLRVALRSLDEILIRHTFGSRDEDIHYEWNPLWQMDDEQKAKIELQKAQAFEVDVKAGLIEPEILKAARENALIESGFLYPGIETAIDEAEEMRPDEEDVDESFPGSPFSTGAAGEEQQGEFGQGFQKQGGFGQK